MNPLISRFSASARLRSGSSSRQGGCVGENQDDGVLLCVGCDVAGRQVAIVTQRGRGAALHQQLHRVDLTLTSSPHQCSQSMRIAAVDRHAAVKQRGDHGSAAMSGCVHHRRLVPVVEHVRIGSGREQAFHEFGAAAIACCHQRRDAFERCRIDPCAVSQQGIGEREVALLAGNDQRRLAEAVARIDRRAAREQPLGPCHIAFARRHQQLAVRRRVAAGLCDRRGQPRKSPYRGDCKHAASEVDRSVVTGRSHKVGGGSFLWVRCIFTRWRVCESSPKLASGSSRPSFICKRDRRDHR